jgi:hypothetical protein
MNNNRRRTPSWITVQIYRHWILDREGEEITEEELTEEQQERVNDGRKLTPWRRMKTDPSCCHDSSVAAAGTRPRSRSLSR